MLYLCLSKGMVKRVANAKIACLDFSLQKTKMKMGVQVVISDPEKLDQIRQRYNRYFFLLLALPQAPFLRIIPFKFAVMLNQ